MEVEIEAAETVEARIAGALRQLFALEDRTHAPSGLYNALYQSNLSVDEVTIRDGSVLVQLSGSLSTGGVCDDPRVEHQIKQTVLQFPEVVGVALLRDGDWLLPSARGAQCFEPDAHCVDNQFLTFWEENGGLSVFGQPVSDLLTEDGRVVQYFERFRFELHLANDPPLDILLGLLGLRAAEARGLPETDPFQPLPDGFQPPPECTYFAESQHQLCHAFRDYWSSHGLEFGDEGVSFRESLMLFGYPISEAFVDPATGLTVQYFERAVFEWHPENQPHRRVLLQPLGTEFVDTPPDDRLSGGALARFDVSGEEFRVWVTNPETIEQLLALKAGESAANIPNGPIRRGPGEADHNSPWSWHLDAEETEMAEVTIEVCDGRPSYVEANLNQFVDQIGRYCPWNAELIELEDRR